MHPSTNSHVYGEPEEWEFDYPFEVIQTAFWLWAMSDFHRLPTQDEVLSYDPRYISDMKLAHTIYSHQGNKSTVMQQYEMLQAQQDIKNNTKEQRHETYEDN